MIKIKEAILVEGKYDKIKLSNLVDTAILCTDGFQIYKNEEMIRLIRKLADSCGVIFFMDSDRAGFRIRSFLKNKLSGCDVKHAFIPDIEGKEKRKSQPSKEGTLGVEGVPDEVILESLRKCGATVIGEVSQKKEIPLFTKKDLYTFGFCGKENSHQKREELLQKLSLPKNMSANLLVDVINSMLCSDLLQKEELFDLLQN